MHLAPCTAPVFSKPPTACLVPSSPWAMTAQRWPSPSLAMTFFFEAALGKGPTWSTLSQGTFLGADSSGPASPGPEHGLAQQCHDEARAQRSRTFTCRVCIEWDSWPTHLRIYPEIHTCWMSRVAVSWGSVQTQEPWSIFTSFQMNREGCLALVTWQLTLILWLLPSLRSGIPYLFGS